MDDATLQSTVGRINEIYWSVLGIVDQDTAQELWFIRNDVEWYAMRGDVQGVEEKAMEFDTLVCGLGY